MGEILYAPPRPAPQNEAAPQHEVAPQETERPGTHDPTTPTKETLTPDETPDIAVMGFITYEPEVDKEQLNATPDREAMLGKVKYKPTPKLPQLKKLPR